jgi:hypothetical protein
MIPAEGFKYDKTQLSEVMKALQKYQVGNKYYYMTGGKIIQGHVYEVNFKVYDHGMTHTTKNELSINFNIIMQYSSGSHLNVPLHCLFETREEAAEQFLKDNDVPAELLRVLKKESTKTVKNLIQNIIENVDPETDLEEGYWEIAKIVEQAYKKKIGFQKITTDFWLCRCNENYINPSSLEWCEICEATREESPPLEYGKEYPKYQFKDLDE